MKHIFTVGVLLGVCGVAHAKMMCKINNIPAITDPGITYTYDDSCYPGDGSTGGDDLLINISACDMCAASSTTNTNGVVVVKSAGKVNGSFPSGGGLVRCTCSPGTTTYKCASGYYGTATSARGGCTACPSNATCAGGNNSTFKCDIGYYKNGTACSRCPSSAGVYGTTGAVGATAITECYLPSGTGFSDSTGSGTYSGICEYSN